MSASPRPSADSTTPLGSPASGRPALSGVHTVSAYDVTLRGDEFVALGDRYNFCPRTYSRFKYGYGEIGELYASVLATVLAEHLQPAQQAGEPIVITGTAYKRVRNAASWLASFTRSSSAFRSPGYSPDAATIYQQRIPEGNYAGMSLDERELRNNDKIWTVDPADFEGKHVVVVDDIRVTGSMERAVVDFMSAMPILSLTLAYLVVIDPEVAHEPQIEDRLNQAAIRDLRDLWLLMEEETYLPTARTARFVLDRDPQQVRWFITVARRDVIQDLYEAAVDDGYNRMPRYRDNFALLAEAEMARREGRVWDVRKRAFLPPRPPGFKLSTWLAQRGW